MKINSTKSILVVAIIFTVALAVANYFFFNSIKKINTETSALSRQVDVYKKERDRLAGKSGVAEILALMEKVNSYFVEKDGVVSFIENIESEARERGVVLLIRSVGTENFGGASEEESKNANKEIMRLKLEARGSWENLMEFVAFLEHLPYKIALENVNFSKTLGDENGSVSQSAPPEKSKTRVEAAPDWRARIELTVLKQK